MSEKEDEKKSKWETRKCLENERREQVTKQKFISTLFSLTQCAGTYVMKRRKRHFPKLFDHLTSSSDGVFWSL